MTSAELHQLHIELIDSEPSIWRRFWLPSTITLTQLHPVLQVVMGWSGQANHWYRQGDVTPADAAPLLPLLAKAPLVYGYDSNDGWLHRITWEQALPLEPHRPLLGCLAGAMACPPEGCGGVWGYDEFLDELESANPCDGRCDEGEWNAASDFDPNRFDPRNVDARLSALNFCLHSD